MTSEIEIIIEKIIIFSVVPRLSLESKKEELNSKLESLANQPFGDSPLFRSAFLVS